MKFFEAMMCCFQILCGLFCCVGVWGRVNCRSSKKGDVQKENIIIENACRLGTCSDIALIKLLTPIWGTVTLCKYQKLICVNSAADNEDNAISLMCSASEILHIMLIAQ